jgi:hypothetical protein
MRSRRIEASSLERSTIAKIFRLQIKGLLEKVVGVFVVLPGFGVGALVVEDPRRVRTFGENRKLQAEHQRDK